MKYRVSFEFEPGNDPADWYWFELLSRVESDHDHIDWSSFTLEKSEGWTPVALDPATPGQYNSINTNS